MTEKWLHSVAKSGNYEELENKPTSLPANGGNADSVGGATINDTDIVDTNSLWTSQKINIELEKKSNKIHNHNASQIIQDSNNRFVTDADKAKWNSIPTTGITGPQGLRGPTGPTGPQGPTGPAGKDSVKIIKSQSQPSGVPVGTIWI